MNDHADTLRKFREAFGRGVMQGGRFYFDAADADRVRQAAAAIAALEAGRSGEAVLNGAMLQAGADALEDYIEWGQGYPDEQRYEAIQKVWSAMLAAAPQQPPPPEEFQGKHEL